MRAALEIARTAGAFAFDSDENVAELLAEVHVRFAGTTSVLGAGTQAVLAFAVAAERMLADVDREARSEIFDVFDRLQERAL